MPSRQRQYAKPQPLKAVLVMRRVSQRSLARALGISENYLSRIVNGYYPPTRSVAMRIADFLGHPEAALFRAGRVPASPHPRPSSSPRGPGGGRFRGARGTSE